MFRQDVSTSNSSNPQSLIWYNKERTYRGHKLKAKVGYITDSKGDLVSPDQNKTKDHPANLSKSATEKKHGNVLTERICLATCVQTEFFPENGDRQVLKCYDAAGNLIVIRFAVSHKFLSQEKSHIAKDSIEACANVFSTLNEHEGNSFTKRRNRTGGSTQAAGGVYTELGYGVGPGKGRGSTEINGQRTSEVFPRSTNGLSERLQHPLGVVNALAAEFIHDVEPLVFDSLTGDGARAVPQIAALVQYPVAPEGLRHIQGNQVALRLSGEPLDCSAETRRFSRSGGSDMHVDIIDGKRRNGSVAVFGCVEPGNDCLGATLEQKNHPMPYSDLAIFERANGGRGCRVQVMHQGFLFAVLMRTQEQLHCSVWPDDP